MFQIFKAVNFDWLKWRRVFIGISVLLMVAGLGSAIFREWKHPNGTNAFNLGVDFRGGTVVTARFKQAATAEQIRATLGAQGLNDAVIQPVLIDPILFSSNFLWIGQSARHQSFASCHSESSASTRTERVTYTGGELRS